MVDHIAHVKELEGDWVFHSLVEHAIGTATQAEDFGAAYQSAQWAWLAGLWHDLGKARPAFQKHIKKSSGCDPNASISSENDPNKNHASTGAMYAENYMEKQGVAAFGRALAYMIAGHHAGLPDAFRDDGGGRSLDEVLADHHFVDEALAANVSPKLLQGFVPNEPLPIDSIKEIHLWVRMVFSALVDADFLDTEAFMQPEKTVARTSLYPDMKVLRQHFDQYMQGLTKNATSSTVNRLRADVLKQAREKAKTHSGIVTMTVPTGGGKTLSSLAFALEHAAAFNKQRIIYAIPYTSIIEQTASIFTTLFQGQGDVVLEHHSNVEPEAGKEITSTRLAAENWDIPIVVTTTVQLFESLYAAKPSRCRKLHNLANSVIVLDETQLLPVHNLNPIRHVIALLSKHYGVTFLLTTATPTPSGGFGDVLGKQLLAGLDTTEIIEQPERYYEQLRRVTYQLPEDFYQTQTWENIAQAISEYPRVLAVVNKRDDAKALFQAMPQDDSLFHLSALMCPKHRKRRIAQIKQRLKDGLPTRVISTQLVEAGVDFDFPVVFRAVAGLDSIIQAGGRCNREGKLKDDQGNLILGRVIVFVPPTPPPKGFLTTAVQTTVSLLQGHQGEIDTPAVIHQYFEKLQAQLREFDRANVLSLLQDGAQEVNIQFRTAAKRFQMIEQGESFSVFMDYGDDEEEQKQVKQWLGMLASGKIDRWIIRKLQPYSISLYQYQKPQYLADGVIQETESGYFMISGAGVYDDQLGFIGTESTTQNMIF